MALTPEQQALRKRIYPRLDGRKPLKPDDPTDSAMYHPIYDAPGCEDSVQLLQDHIELSTVESFKCSPAFAVQGKPRSCFAYKGIWRKTVTSCYTPMRSNTLALPKRLTSLTSSSCSRVLSVMRWSDGPKK